MTQGFGPCSLTAPVGSNPTTSAKEKVMEKKIFLTEYKKDGKSFGDRVEAYSWWEAEILLIQTGRHEKVIGELVDEFDFS